MRASADNHIGLRTADLDDAARFWCDALGGTLATTPVVRSDAGVEAVFGPGATIKVAQITFADGGGIELFEFLAPQSAVPPLHQPSAAIMHFAFTVDDIDAAVERIAAAGGAVLGAPMQVAGAESGPRFVYCESPEGHPFELVTVGHAGVVEFVRALRGETAAPAQP
jgi:catechol 2,3-dioxygenase-like lactoylglutathione lyase family enzyme